jgi:acyl phosphate:glycerol-3-phosphate acyltransferase
MTVITAAMVGLAYLLGSIPTGFIVGSWAGVDVRKSGSGNVGATNVARVVGKRQGIYTLAADMAKGFLPVFIALQLGLSTSSVALVAIAAFLGHLFPVFLKFRGGKGVATALGVFLALAPWASLVLVLLFAVAIWVSRIVSLSSMITAVAAPAIFWCLSYSAAFIETSAFLAVMIVVRHRSNIQRLLAGTEPKFGA